MFHEDAASVTAVPEYRRDVVVSRPVMGKLLLLATSALGEALNMADATAHARAELSFRSTDESLADEAGAR